MKARSSIRRELEEFFRSGGVAARAERRGLLDRGRREVPAGCFGAAAGPGREDTAAIVDAGGTVAPARDRLAWIVRSGAFPLSLRAEGLCSADGFSFSAALDLRVEVPPSAGPARLFISQEKLPGRVRAEDLARMLLEALRAVFFPALEAEGIEAILALARDPAAVGERLRRRGEEEFVERGLAVIEVRGLRIDCPGRVWARPLRPSVAERPESAGQAVEAAVDIELQRMVYIVCGKSVYAAGAETLQREGCTPEEISFAGGELGWLRSARIAESPPGPVLLAGAQAGVYAALGGFGASVQSYRLPEGTALQGGANAAAIHGGYLYATHSACGLARWRLAAAGEPPPPPDLLHDLREAGERSARGIRFGPSGLGYFAAGDRIIAFEPRSGMEDDADGGLKVVRAAAGAGSPIAAFEVDEGSGGCVLAGLEDGRVVRWSLAAGGGPEEICRAGKRPVSALRRFHRGGRDRFLVAAGERRLEILDPDGAMEAIFRAEEPVRWADACGPVICGAARGGRRLYVWEWARREGIVRRIDFPEPIRDIAAGPALAGLPLPAAGVAAERGSGGRRAP